MLAYLTFVILLALSARAAPVLDLVPRPYTLPLTRVDRSRNQLLTKRLVELDRTHVERRKISARAGIHTIPATNWQLYYYIAVIGIGQPPTDYNLFIDTGSSSTFVGTGTKPYVRTSTSIDTDEKAYVSYGQGFWSGEEYLDQVTIGPGLVIANQSIGDALESAYFSAIDGILGVGPVDLTPGTLSPDRNATIPTVIDNAYAQGLIPERVLAVEYAPTLALNASVNGALTFGGVDSRYADCITYVPVTTTHPASTFWGINITSVDYGNSTNLFKNYAGIVDTGTTLIYIADDFFAKYQAAIPGSFLATNTTGMLEVPASSLPFLQDVNFLIGGKTFTLSPSAQLIPQGDVVAWSGELGHYYSYIAPAGHMSGTGWDFTIGEKFLERFYSVYDATNNRVGFAYTEYTFEKL